MKLQSYIKALIPGDNIKGFNLPPHMVNQIGISPKDNNDLSGINIIRNNNTSNVAKWNPNIDIEYLQKIYECNDLVHSCIELISSTCALARLRVKVRGSNGKYRYENSHPLQLLLDHPNSSMSGYDLMQAYVVHKYLIGTVSLLLIRENVIYSNDKRNICPVCDNQNKNCDQVMWHSFAGKIGKIIPCNPNILSTEEIETKNGIVKYIKCNFNGMGDLYVHPNNIIIDSFYNPIESMNGISPTAQVQRWLEVDLGLSEQVGAYLTNNAIPSMILNIKPTDGTLSQDPTTMLERLKEKWMRDFSIGGSDKSKVKTPAFVHGEMEVHKIQDALKDIVVKPLFYEIQNRICMVFGVPPNLFEFGQDYGSQSTTILQQEKNFYNRTISKNLTSFKSKVEKYILPFYNEDNIELEWDLSNMGIASFIKNDHRNYILKTWELGLITRDHAREELGMDPIETSNLGDDLYRETVMGNTVEKPIDNRLLVDNYEPRTRRQDQ